MVLKKQILLTIIYNSYTNDCEVKLWLRFRKKRTTVSRKDKKNCKYIILRTSTQKTIGKQ